MQYRIAHFVFEGVTGRFFKITNMVYFCHDDLVLSLQNSADPDEMLIVVAVECSGRVPGSIAGSASPAALCYILEQDTIIPA